jgi:hypothetical protein
MPTRDAAAVTRGDATIRFTFKKLSIESAAQGEAELTNDWMPSLRRTAQEFCQQEKQSAFRF